MVSSFCGMFCKHTTISDDHSPTLSTSASLLPLYFIFVLAENKYCGLGIKFHFVPYSYSLFPTTLVKENLSFPWIIFTMNKIAIRSRLMFISILFHFETICISSTLWVFVRLLTEFDNLVKKSWLFNSF